MTPPFPQNAKCWFHGSELVYYNKSRLAAKVLINPAAAAAAAPSVTAELHNSCWRWETKKRRRRGGRSEAVRGKRVNET